MYRKRDLGLREFIEFEKFHLPFSGKISPNNRWVKKACIIPWRELESDYAKLFSQDSMGAPGISFRIAFGSLLIQSTCRYTDEETVQQIRENPYLQFFLGFHEYSYEPPFDPSMMTHFRKRISEDMLKKINDQIAGVKKDDNNDDSADGNHSSEKEEVNKSQEPENKGKLIVDATCTPADIRFPTDISLLNEAREKTEKAIDILHKSKSGKTKKPRTYRKKARKAFLRAIKSKKKSASERRKHIGRQLNYVKRNLNHIGKMTDSEPGLLTALPKKEYQDLLVIQELFRQQKQMFDLRINHIEDRIVSISQPHIRPIVRGKAAAMTEFGAKISISVVNGYSFADRIGWNNFNEGSDLPLQIEEYKKRFGFYPVSVHADKKYQTRLNRDYCSERSIRFLCQKLGRPNDDTGLNKKYKRKMLDDLIYRIRIEGKIGVAKRKYGLGRIMTKLKQTSVISIHMGLLAMNLDVKLRALLSALLSRLGIFLKLRVFQ